MKLLLIEDELELGESIQAYLKDKTFVCEWATTVSEGIEKLTSFEYECVILDLMLAGDDGFEVLKNIKKLKKSEGVIVISAKENLETRLESFHLGADDYITKPFHLSELLVRIQALIRRKNFNGNSYVTFNEIEIDIFSKTVKLNNQKIDFTKKEIDLLLYLIGNENKVLSKSAIAEHLSGDMADMLDNHDFVYAHIKNLKKKLSKYKCNNYIKSIYGLGYKWQND
ncbi:MAG: response regulator transcription factor [Pseudarcicella sp.]|nr:response regulator transcription factor [Pseudarcicella sp.]MBP6410034.1 response regulator transcription factor [Pseudarcicella sp.]